MGNSCLRSFAKFASLSFHLFHFVVKRLKLMLFHRAFVINFEGMFCIALSVSPQFMARHFSLYVNGKFDTGVKRCYNVNIIQDDSCWRIAGYRWPYKQQHASKNINNLRKSNVFGVCKRICFHSLRYPSICVLVFPKHFTGKIPTYRCVHETLNYTRREFSNI